MFKLSTRGERSLRRAYARLWDAAHQEAASHVEMAAVQIEIRAREKRAEVRVAELRGIQSFATNVSELLTGGQGSP